MDIDQELWRYYTIKKCLWVTFGGTRGWNCCYEPQKGTRWGSGSELLGGWICRGLSLEGGCVEGSECEAYWVRGKMYLTVAKAEDVR